MGCQHGRVSGVTAIRSNQPMMACLQRMVKQTAAAQRRAEAEARKAAKATAGSTAADTGHAASVDSLQADRSAGAAVSDDATEVKAETATEAAQASDSHLVPAGKTQVAAARTSSAKQGEKQDLNSLASAAAGVEGACKEGTVPRASRKRATEASDEVTAAASKRRQATRSIKGQQGDSMLMGTCCHACSLNIHIDSMTSAQFVFTVPPNAGASAHCELNCSHCVSDAGQA